MGAPKGNQNAKGNKGGVVNRKPPQDVFEIADALIKWSESPDACHWVQFTRKWRKTRTWIHGLAKNHKEIADAREIARGNILRNYIENGLYRRWCFPLVNRYIGYFDPDLKEYEIEMKRREKEINDKEKEELIVKVIDYANSTKQLEDPS